MNLHRTYHDLIQYFSIRKDLSVPYRKEIERLSSLSNINFYNLVFPYEYIEEVLHEEIEIVMTDGYPTYRDGDKDVYLPKNWSIERCRDYIRLLKCEQNPNSPHLYQSASGRVVLDLGCAEGIYSLRSINKCDEIYAFDSSEWKEPLSMTFKDFHNFHFMEGSVGYSNPIDDLNLKDVDEIKMDIEGMEYEALVSAENTIITYHPKLQICVYHGRDDFQLIYNLISSFGYTNITTSPGYIVYPHGKQEPPYFRRGILYAIYRG